MFFTGPQQGRGMTPDRNFGKASAEAVILYIFLRFGGIKTVLADSEVLRHFELACLNYETNRRIYEETQAIRLTQEYDSEDEGYIPTSKDHHMDVNTRKFKEKYFSDDDMPSTSMTFAQDAAQSRHTPQGKMSQVNTENVDQLSSVSFFQCRNGHGQ